MYIFSSASLLTLNLRDLNKFSLVHAAAVMLLICSVQLQVVLNVKPKCLCDVMFVISVPFIQRGGWGGGCLYKDKIIDKVLAALKSTSQSAPYINAVESAVENGASSVWVYNYYISRVERKTGVSQMVVFPQF